jgi:hypothetical protein
VDDRLARYGKPDAAEPVDDLDETLAANELALRTHPDETLPVAAAQVAETQRIAEQFVGPRS